MALRIFGIVGVIGLAILAGLFFLTRSSEPEWFVDTSSVSPDNSLIAENSMQGEENLIGRVSVRKQNGTVVYETIFDRAVQPLFFRWTDSRHLQVLYDSRGSLPRIIKTTDNGSIEVSYSPFVQLGPVVASRVAKSHVSLTINPSDLSASFDETPRRPQRATSCQFGLTARDGKEFTEIGLALNAVIYVCHDPKTAAEKLCGSIGAHFTVGQRIDAAAGGLLTSATVSGIDVNLAPYGMGYRSLAGGFAGLTAAPLLEALGSDSFYIDYNFDFDQRNIRYSVPAAAISEPLTKFRSCVGSAPLQY